MKKICAIYTRKSTDERLDMEFNTLDAQRESCEAYVTSQKSDGWVISREKYDDGGYSGGSLDRPALQRLLDDIKAGRVHIVVVYKIDRLTRSLMDFAKLVQVFDEHGVTFVSVTQSFNTTTSMGRLTLNVLLSFAQFEREVSGERIRDKIAASKARGMWMGGVPPVGYKIEHRQLIVKREEVPLARKIFDRYLALGSVRFLKEELDRKGIRTPIRKSLSGQTYGGKPFSRGALYWLLKNPAYVGKISHKGKIHEGLHEGIIPVKIWERVQIKLKERTVARSGQVERRFMLRRLIYDTEGTLYGTSYTSRHGRQYCYYVSQNIKENREHPCYIMARLPMHEIEATVEKALRQEIRRISGKAKGPVIDHILKHHQSIPAYDLVRSCVERIIVGFNQLTIKVRPQGFQGLAENYLKLKLECHSGDFEIVIPFTIVKEHRGAIVIEPTNAKKDIFDLPPHKLKKLIQGVVWRDEHFAGLTLKVIADRECCSEAYVSTAIFGSFETLQNRLPATA